MKKLHQHYKNAKGRRRKKIVVSYQYQAKTIRGKEGLGHIEISVAENFNLSTDIIKNHIENTLLEDNEMKATVVILGISEL